MADDDVLKRIRQVSQSLVFQQILRRNPDLALRAEHDRDAMALLVLEAQRGGLTDVALLEAAFRGYRPDELYTAPVPQPPPVVPPTPPVRYDIARGDVLKWNTFQGTDGPPTIFNFDGATGNAVNIQANASFWGSGFDINLSVFDQTDDVTLYLMKPEVGPQQYDDPDNNRYDTDPNNYLLAPSLDWLITYLQDNGTGSYTGQVFNFVICHTGQRGAAEGFVRFDLIRPLPRLLAITGYNGIVLNGQDAFLQGYGFSFEYIVDALLTFSDGTVVHPSYFYITDPPFQYDGNFTRPVFSVTNTTSGVGSPKIGYHQLSFVSSDPSVTTNALPIMVLPRATPASVPRGGTVTITHNVVGGLGISQLKVGFPSVDMPFIDQNGKLVFNVPDNALPGANGNLYVVSAAAVPQNGAPGGFSFLSAFNILANPYISSLSPTNVSAQSATFSVVLTGNYFTNVTAAYVWSASSGAFISVGFSVTNDTTMTVSVPGGVPTPDTDVQIYVVNAQGNSNKQTFHYTRVVILTSLSKNNLFLQGDTLTINGSAMTRADSPAEIFIGNDHPSSISSVSASAVSIVTGTLSAYGTKQVYVSDEDGPSNTLNIMVWDRSASSVIVGQTFRLFGGSFAGTTSVVVKGTAATFVVASDSSYLDITTSGATALGLGDVVVQVGSTTYTFQNAITVTSALTTPTVTSVNSPFIDPAGGSTLIVLGTSLSTMSALQVSVDGVTWLNCTGLSSTTTTGTGTTPAITAGPVFVRVTNSIGTSTSIKIEAWSPANDSNVSLMFDPKTSPYNATTGTWVPRVDIMGSGAGTLTSLNASKPASDGNGGVLYDGDGANEIGLGTADPRGVIASYFGAQLNSNQPGSLFSIHLSQTTSSDTAAGYNSVPYEAPSLIGNMVSATNGLGAFVIDGVHSTTAHICDSSGAYAKVFVPSSANVLHTHLSRWSTVPGSTNSIEVSIDGALTGTGYNSAAVANPNGGTYGAYTNSKITSGTRYDASSPSYQTFKGTLRAMGILKDRATNAFVSKLARWAIGRFGVPGPTLGVPVMASLSVDVLDPVGGDVVVVTGVNLSSLTSVTLGGVAVTVTPISSSSFSFVMPAKTKATYALIAINATGPSLPLYIEVWDPASLLNLQTYLDVRKNLTTSGANVTGWSDSFGNAWTQFTGAGNAGNPQLVSAVFGTKPGIRMTINPANNVFQGFISPTGRLSLYSSFAGIRTTNNKTMFDGYQGNAPMTLFGDLTGSVCIQFGLHGGRLMRTIYDPSFGWTTTFRGANYNDGKPRMVGVSYDPIGSYSLYQNWVYQGSDLLGQSFLQAPSGGPGWSAFGGGYSGGSYGCDGYVGDVAFIVTTTSVISQTDLVKLDTWSRATFGINTPRITSLSNDISDPTGGAPAVTLTGPDAGAATALYVNQAPVAFTVLSATSISFYPPPNQGPMEVQIKTAGGFSNTLNLESWNPTYLTNVAAVLDAGLDTKYVNALATWIDQGVNGYSFQAQSVAGSPQIIPNVFGSVPAVRFDRLTQKVLNGPGAQPAVFGQPFSFYFVGKWTSIVTATVGPTTDAPLTVMGWSGGWNGFGASAGRISSTSYDSGGANTRNKLGTKTTLNDGAPHLIGSEGSSAGAITLYSDNTIDGTDTAQVYYGANLIGNGFNLSDGFDGDLGAIVVTKAILTAAEHAKIWKWFLARFISAVTAPFIQYMDYDTLPTVGGTTVTIFGFGLFNASVKVNGLGVKVLDTSFGKVRFTAPASAAGGYTVQVFVNGVASNVIWLYYEDAGLLWMDAKHAYIPPVGNGPGVSRITSSSAYLGISATQTTVTARPTLFGSHYRFNNKPVIYFDGINDWLATPISGTASPQPYTIYFIASWLNPLSTNYLFDDVDATSRISVFDGGPSGGGIFQFYAGSSMSAGTQNLPGNVNIVAITVTAGSGSIYVNDAITPKNTAAVGADGFKSMIIGSRYSLTNGSFFQGLLGAIAVFAGAHDVTTRTRNMERLRLEYGMPWTLVMQDYGGLPWASLDTGIDAGSRTMIAGANPSIASTLANGHAGAQFSGAQFIHSGPSGNQALSYLFASLGNAYYFEIVFQADALVVTGGPLYYDATLATAAPDGTWDICVNTAGARAGHYDGVSYKETTPLIPMSVGVKYFGQMKYDGTTISLRLNGGAWSTVAAGNIPSTYLTDILRIGANYNVSRFFTGIVWGHRAMPICPTQAECDARLVDAVTTFGLNSPILTSMNYVVGDKAGGDSIIITGQNLAGATLTINGTSVTVTGTTATTITFTTPAIGSGNYDVQATTTTGMSNKLKYRAWSPVDLALTTFRRASYAGVPWAGVASAGASTGRNLTQATGAKVPATGTAVNGKTPAVFTTAGQRRLDDVTLATAFGSGSTFSGVALVYIDSISSAFGTAKNSSAVIASSVSSGRFAVYLQMDGTVPKIAVYTYNSASSDQTTTPAPIGLAGWKFVHWKYDGINLSIGYNGSWIASIPAAAMTDGGFNLQWGEATSANAWFDGKMLENGTMAAAIADQDLQLWAAVCACKYGINLT